MPNFLPFASFSIMKKQIGKSFILLLLYTLLTPSCGRDAIDPKRSLTDGEILVSTGGTFALGFFSPTNSTNRYVGIWYNNITVQTVVWVANRQNPIMVAACSLMFGTNGTLMIIAPNSTILWSTNSIPVQNPLGQLLDTGNFVVREATNGSIFVWESFNDPTDTLLPGMKLAWDRRTGHKGKLTAWTSDSDPSPSKYYIAVDIRGDPQITLYDDSGRMWRSGPWNGVDFSGCPVLNYYISIGFTFNLVTTADEIYYTYSMTNQSILTRVVASQTGKIQRWIWINGRSTKWNLFWYSPVNQCDNFAFCGSYASCDPNRSPVCMCYEGFEPKSTVEWNQFDWTNGCVRKTKLNCKGGTDGFLTMTGVSLPDTSNATVHWNIGPVECRAKCLMNCSCTGYANTGVHGGNTGCIIWVSEMVDIEMYVKAGQDLYVRLAAADLVLLTRTSRSHRRRLAVITVAVSVGLALLLLAFVSSYTKRKYKRKEGYNGEDKQIPIFDMGTLLAATDNFSTEKMIGEGGFGPVYKGKLGNGQDIAVKRLSKSSTQGINEFKNEVMLIAKLQHRNLVRLLGYCIHGAERMLIYEYMANKSLDVFLFGTNIKVLLDWEARRNIIGGIARGLLYLHQDSRCRVIHRDLKTGNILLDKEMIPKISDFGMARIFGGDDELTSKTKKVVGTYGYMSPEYAMNGIFSVKSDVYSFGVLVLEVISGQRNGGLCPSDPHRYLLGHAWNLWNEGNSLEFVDPSISMPLETVEILRCINVGLLCVQECPEDRPTMSAAVFMLDSLDAPILEPKQPGFVGRLDFPLPERDCSGNELTMSMIIGR